MEVRVKDKNGAVPMSKVLWSGLNLLRNKNGQMKTRRWPSEVYGC